MSSRESCYNNNSNHRQVWVVFQLLDNHLREPAAGHWKRFVGRVQRGVDSWRERSNHNHLRVLKGQITIFFYCQQLVFAKNCEKLSAMLIVRAEEKGQITSWLSTQLQIMCLVKTDADVKKSSFSLIGPKLYIELCFSQFCQTINSTPLLSSSPF